MRDAMWSLLLTPIAFSSCRSVVGLRLFIALPGLFAARGACPTLAASRLLAHERHSQTSWPAGIAGLLVSTSLVRTGKVTQLPLVVSARSSAAMV